MKLHALAHPREAVAGPVPVTVPLPSSATSSFDRIGAIAHEHRRACGARGLTMFVSASWTMRYAETSIPGGRPLRSPWTRELDRHARVAHRLDESLDAWRLGRGARLRSSSSLRRSPSRRLISARASLPVRSIARQSLACLRTLVSECEALGPRLHDHDADAVADDIVESRGRA